MALYKEDKTMDKICKRCLKVKNNIDKSGFCDICMPIEMEEYARIKAFLNKHKKATMIEVKEATGIQYKVIERLIEYGGISRLEE